MRSAGNASIFSIRVLLSAGISVPSTRLLVAFYQHTPPLPMPRPVSRHRAREGADRWSGDIRSFPGCAGLSGKNVLARLTGPGLAANDLQSSCADLFRVSTPASQPLQGVDGRHKAHGCPVRLFAAATQRCRRPRDNFWFPLAGLGPATHVFECGSIDSREGVDGRDKPGQGDRRLYRVRYQQPFLLNRTAVAQGRPRRNWGREVPPFIASRFSPDSPAILAGRLPR